MKKPKRKPKKTTIQAVENARTLLKDHPDLVEQRQWADLAELANQAGYRSPMGKKWTGPNKGQVFYLFLRRFHLVEEPLPETWVTQIRELIQNEVRQVLAIPSLPTLPQIRIPPERVKTKGIWGRPVGQGERVKVGITLDKNLFERFEAERKRLGLSASGYADVVLWNFFGQPPMSYEEPGGLKE
jgi:hypothetical protein